MKQFTAIFMVLLIAAFGFAQTITIDGDMSDWDAAMQMDVAPNELEGIGDSIDVNWDGTLDGVINPALDVQDMFVTHDDDFLYIRIDINENGTFTDLLSMVDGGMQAAIELFIDTDCDTSTGLTWGWWYTSGDYWINLSVPYGWPGFELTHKYGILKFIGSNGSDSQWEEVIGDSCLVAVNLDDNKMEVAIPRAAIGETNGDFESTAILNLNEDPTAGWNADIVPNSIGSERYVYRYGRSQITIDGDMSDWAEATKFDVSPNMEEGLQDSVDSDWDGIMDGIINPALDIQDVFVSHDDEFLYVRIDINENGTFTDLDGLVADGAEAPIQLYFDVDIDSSTGLTWGYWLNGGDYYVNITNPYGNPGLEVTHAYGLLHHIGLNGNDESFEEVIGDSCLVAINLDDNKIEVAIPRAAIGEINGENESTAILVFSEDPTVDWVNDAAPSDDGSFRNIYNYGRPLGDLTGVEDRPVVRPVDFTLSQNYPNPFNPTTTINYTVNKAQKLNISVYNILGQKVAVLFNGAQVAGAHQAVWNGINLSGAMAPTGIYFYRVQGENEVKVKKMILTK